MRLMRLALIVIVSLAIVPAAVFAQASMAGVVRDTSGAVLPGVTVEATSPALIEKVRSVVTDGTGRFRIEDLRPGAYTAIFTLPGFATLRREGIELTGTFVATVNAELRVGALEETITVTGEVPTVDVQSTLRQQVMTREILDSIPFGRSDRDLSILVPGTSTDRVDVGGSATTVSGRALIHGSRGSSQRILQSGLSIAVPFDGSGSSQQANLAAYQEVVVDTAAVDATQDAGGVRVNLIPKDGGNSFSGTFFGSFANEAMQNNNYTQELKDRGLRTPDTIKRIYDINPGFGGPIKKDKVWFFAAVRYNGSSQYPAEIFYNLNANNPNAWTYVPDLARRPINDSWWRDMRARVTWQVTNRNKVGLMWGRQHSCYCPETISATTSPESALDREFPGQSQPAVDWTSPVTSRVLLEAGVLRYRSPTLRSVLDGTNPSVAMVTDQGLGNLNFRGNSGEIRERTINMTLFYRFAASYITGAHAVKAGITGGSSDYTQSFAPLSTPFTFRFNNGVPNRITIYASPYMHHLKILQTGLYAQHRWTIDRLTLTYGARYDFLGNWFPETLLGPGPLAPARTLTLPAVDPGIRFHDITPKSGAAYDLFGNGKTALKATLNKYLEGQGAQGPFGTAMSPASRIVTSTTRSWNDANRNFVPDCDLTNPAANGECLAMANRNFGTVVTGATYDPELISGWGKRGNNWEFSAGVQHELVAGTSVDVSYFRRWYGNFVVTDNRAVAATDFDTFSITAPAHPSLPGGGGGYAVSGLYDVNPAKFGVPADNFITLADNYGKQTEHWNGFDVTMNARPRSGVILQGGLSTGRTSTDNCEVSAKVPEMLLGLAAFNTTNANVWTPADFCRVREKFLTQFKFLGSYTIPRLDLQVSGRFQSLPGPQILSNYDASSAVVSRSLGRNLAGGQANVSVNLVEPGTMFGERMNQFDLRVAKVLRFGRLRASPSLDVFNMFNSNPVLTQSNAFATWLRPQAILLARFVKVGVQLDF